MDWVSLLSPTRQGKASSSPAPSFTPDRTPFQVDSDRLIFSSAFRRLHDKTQVFPFPEDDLVHSRLTHSLEVACVGRSLGTRVGQRIVAEARAPAWATARELGDIVSAACLAHDIGNPPFGHSGEDAIATWFQGPGARYTAELTAVERASLELFEGNAQGFRLLTRLLSPANPGLRLTHATLAAFTKYPRQAVPRGAALSSLGVVGKKHGFHPSEADIFAEVAAVVGLAPRALRLDDGLEVAAWQRHPLAFLVEAADDICYAILDLEDGVRLGHVSFEHARALLLPIAERHAWGAPRSLRERSPAEDEQEYVGYLRATAIGTLVDETVEAFEAEEPALLGGETRPALPKRIPSAALLESIKRDTRRLCYEAREVLEIEIAGYEVVHHLLGALVPAALSAAPSARERKLLRLLPQVPPPTTTLDAILRITDFVSGMTDSYAVSLFRKLSGVDLPARSRATG